MSTAILPKADTSDFLAHFDDGTAMASDSASALPSQKDATLLQKVVGQAIKNVEDAHTKLQSYLAAKYKDSDLTGDVSKHSQYMVDYADAYTALINQNLNDTKAIDTKSHSGSSRLWVRVSPMDLKVTADFMFKPSTKPVEINHMDAGEEYLEHFGVLGMHWGRHLPGRNEPSHNAAERGTRVVENHNISNAETKNKLNKAAKIAAVVVVAGAMAAGAIYIAKKRNVKLAQVQASKKDYEYIHAMLNHHKLQSQASEAAKVSPAMNAHFQVLLKTSFNSIKLMRA